MTTSHIWGDIIDTDTVNRGLAHLRAGGTVVVKLTTHPRPGTLAQAAHDAGLLIAVDRFTPWGNPHTPGDYLPGRQYPLTPGEAVSMYAQWLADRLNLVRALVALRGRALGCWCHPLPCHAHVLASAAQHPGTEQEVTDWLRVVDCAALTHDARVILSTQRHVTVTAPHLAAVDRRRAQSQNRAGLKSRAAARQSRRAVAHGTPAEDIVSRNDAARLLNVTPHTVTLLGSRGHLQRAGRGHVTRASVTEYLTSREEDVTP